MLESGEIVREVHSALGRDLRVDLHSHSIVIEYLPDERLVLQGETESLAAKKIALELAASIGGSIGIVDRLRVAPARPMGDGAIRDHLGAARLQEGAFTDCTIQTPEEHRVRAAAEAADRGNYLEIAAWMASTICARLKNSRKRKPWNDNILISRCGFRPMRSYSKAR